MYSQKNTVMKGSSTQKIAGNWEYIDWKRKDFRILHGHILLNSLMCYNGIERKWDSEAYHVGVFNIS